MKERLTDIDVAKGIAIVLVVMGHVVARDIRPAGNEWYPVFNHHLYAFHMSFFFYLAGYVFWTSESDRRGERVRQAAQRMLPAYLMMAIFTFFAKWSLARFVAVDRPVREFWSAWFQFFLYPTEGFITFLWFIVALLEIYLLTLVALRLFRESMGWMLACAAVLHLCSVAGWVTGMFALKQATRYWLFFVVASFALANRARLNPWIIRAWPLTLAALIISLVMVPSPWDATVGALISLPALHGIAAASERLLPRVAAGFARLGIMSWPIYLFNVFAIGGVKVIILKTMGWDGARFFIALPLLVAGGITLPILVQRFVLSRWEWLDRMTR